jgi:ketosteroid isomerase-like protein
MQHGLGWNTVQEVTLRAIHVIAALTSLYTAGAQTVTAPGNSSDFNAFLRTFEEGLTRFVNGDATLWKKNASRSDIATILGAWGAYEKGWPEVGSRYDWAAARFQPSGAKVNVEYLSTVVSGDLACTVTIERSTVRLVDQEKVAPMALRVTHVFRREAGEWKLLHRHADVLTPRTAPATVLQK